MSVKKRSKKLLIVGIGLVLAAVAVGGVGSSVAQAQGPYFGRSGGPFGGMMGGWGPGGMMGGMMGGWGPGGMMGGYGWGGRSGQPYYGNSTPISIEQATQSVQSYLATGGESDLVPTEVLEFQWNFYAMVKEKSTGVNAFELLVDKYSGAAYPEMGPNMMWNTKYGMMAHMGGMMGGFYWLGASPTQMPVTPKQAQEIAQGYLDRYLPGTTTEEPDAFYGYYTVHTLQDGKVSGMLSVNGYTGSVWYHSWHGTFVQEKELLANNSK